MPVTTYGDFIHCWPEDQRLKELTEELCGITGEVFRVKEIRERRWFRVETKYQLVYRLSSYEWQVMTMGSDTFGLENKDRMSGFICGMMSGTHHGYKLGVERCSHSSM